ncbi:tyrosine-type recombinase/integrase [Streptomyces sp. HUAS TT7]|uniref:tyrosine-type recombinase/integrase n=1 Tax=Streptomyces sp. HUAS TT7 TaxID=3447507 RepID=UPI003F656B76
MGSRYRVAGIPGVRDRSFKKLKDAKTWLGTAIADQAPGELVDPHDGSITLADYVASFWHAGARGAAGTRQGVERRVRLHILPHLGALSLREITPACIRGYIPVLEAKCSPRYSRQILTVLSNIFEAAVDDRRLARNPVRAKSVRWPRVPESLREIWEPSVSRRVHGAIRARYRIAVVLALGCGLRQGEAFGLSPADVDFERGVLHVRWQDTRRRHAGIGGSRAGRVFRRVSVSGRDAALGRT